MHKGLACKLNLSNNNLKGFLPSAGELRGLKHLVRFSINLPNADAYLLH